jgi:hypothetical protein
MPNHLHDLIKEAEQNVRPASHGQRESDHVWEAVGGGRGCPRGGDGSQAIYECAVCPEMDYGDPPGPGFQECFGSLEGCEGCLSFEQIEEIKDALNGTLWNPLEQYTLRD